MNYPTDSIVHFLKRQNTLSTRYSLLDYFISRNSILVFDSSFYSIPNEFQLTEREQDDFESYQYYYGIQKQIIMDTNARYVLDSLQIDSLSYLVYNTDNYYAANALALLKLNNTDYQYYEITSHSSESYPPRISRPDVISEDQSIIIYPNPSKGLCIIESSENFNYKVVNITFLDALGRVVLSESLDLSSHISTVDVTNLKSGNYVVIIKNCDQEIYVHKHVIIND